LGALDCNEYDNLVRRRFEDYSEGHRIMYEVPIRLLSGKQWSIREAGFGIGWGLDQMVEAKIIRTYSGCEPCADSFNYTKKNHGGRPNVFLSQTAFKRDGAVYDHVFCIEVIEHVPMDGHYDFLKDLRESTGRTLWMSTPDKRKHPSEGVRTCDEWRQMLREAGFKDVTMHREQWTVLFVAQ
jgi:hypothetical protein